MKNPDGTIKYVTRATIRDQISKNVNWASTKRITIDSGELVTGEHSGFFVLPQQPADNPNLAGAFQDTGIRWAGSDNSRDPQPRKVGPAMTVPRYPINIFFNAATKAEEVDEYNWIYTSKAQGGSGVCEDNPQTSTCLSQPLSVSQFDSYIVPLQAQIVLSHILNNDPRPHYVHQSNLTEDRIIYPVLDSIMGQYKAIYADNAPIVCQRLGADSTQLSRQSAWQTLIDRNKVSGYVQDGKVVVSVPAGTAVPITAPEGTKIGATGIGGVYGVAYAGERSAYTQAGLLTSVTLKLPA